MNKYREYNDKLVLEAFENINEHTSSYDIGSGKYIKENIDLFHPPFRAKCLYDNYDLNERKSDFQEEYDDQLHKAELIYTEFCNSEAYIELSKIEIFDAEIYKKVPFWTVEKHYYSLLVVLSQISNDDWRNRVFSYLTYISGSFGSFPNKIAEPLCLDFYIRTLEKIIEMVIEGDGFDKYRERLYETIDYLKYMNNYSIADFQELVDTYNKWYREFPFEFPFFDHLKQKYNNPQALEAYKKVTLEDIGYECIIQHTKSSLLNLLIDITNETFVSIDTAKFYDKKYITDTQKYELDLVMKQHANEQKLYSFKYSAQEEGYQKRISNWLETELKFLPMYKKILSSAHFPEIETVWSSESSLIDAYKKLSKEKYIKCDLESWLHWFGSQKCINPKKIKWVYKDGIKRSLTYFIEKISVDNTVNYSKARVVFEPKIYHKDAYNSGFVDIDAILGIIKPTGKINT